MNLPALRAIGPNPRIYEILIKRFAVDPQRAVFVDDTAVNVEAARCFDLHGIHFREPNSLRLDLVKLGFL